MRKALIVTGFSLVLFAADPSSQAPTPPETIRIYYPFGGKAMARWTFGAFVGREDSAPVIYAFNKQAQQIGNLIVRTPAEASAIRLYRAVRTPDGGTQPVESLTFRSAPRPTFGGFPLMARNRRQSLPARILPMNWQ